MVRQRSEFLFAAFIGVAWFAVGCGGDGSIYSETVAAKVTSVEVSPSSLAVNQQTTLLVGFDAATYTPGDFDQTDDDSPSAQSVAFDLVIRLARGLDYVVNSSTLTDSLTGDVIFGNSDPRGPNSVGLCEDGSRFLLYRFGDFVVLFTELFDVSID